MMKRAMSFYRLMLWAYPPGFRKEFGDEMLLAFEDSLRAAVRKDKVTGFWWLMARDLFMSSAREWLLMIRRQSHMDPTAFDSQVLSTVRFMSRALRDGYSVHQISTMIADNAPEPTASIFRDFADKLLETKSPNDALEVIEGQLESQQYANFVTVMKTQLAEGGNLADRYDEFAANLDDGIDWSADVELSG